MYKESIIVPLYKKGSRAKAENYRPISLTDHIGKAFERVIRKRLVNYFESRGLFKDIQHGFRRKRSTLTQLLQHFDEVYNNFLDEADTDSVYLDYAKAFDKVDHGILLKKLESYGVHEKLIRWIKDFLADRKQRVVVNGVKSRAVWVRSGVIQGSVLGPILFIIFINDIADVVKGSTVRCFADDSRLIKMVNSQEDVETLQKDLDAVVAWSERNNMSLHKDKFELMTQRSRGKRSPGQNERAPIRRGHGQLRNGSRADTPRERSARPGSESSSRHDVERAHWEDCRKWKEEGGVGPQCIRD